MKKIISKVMLLLLLLTSIVSVNLINTEKVQAAPNIYYVVPIEGNGLNLRKNPGGSVLTVIPNYNNVVMLSYNESYSGGENWSRIDYNGTIGYVATRFLVQQNQISYYYVIPISGNGLNLRSAPNGSIKLVIPNYGKVTMINYNTSWSYVEYNGNYGYVSTQYLGNNMRLSLPVRRGTNKQITADYQDPDYLRTYGEVHNAIDFAGGLSISKDILAAGSGTVSAVGWEGGNGNVIRIDHGNGIVTRYSHLAQFKVSKGQYVNAGDVIGIMGETGQANGVHLHFQVLKNGSFVNPRDYMDLPAKWVNIN